MNLDGVAAKALFSLVLTTAQGADWLSRQQPLQTEERGDAWLVKGTPFSDKFGDFITCYAFFRRRDAKVTGINCAARFKWTDADRAKGRREISPGDYAQIFEPPRRFEPNGIPELWSAIYKGIVTTPADALAYARIVLRAEPALAGLATEDLLATERDRVWHVAARGHPGDLVRISREDGSVALRNPP